RCPAPAAPAPAGTACAAATPRPASRRGLASGSGVCGWTARRALPPANHSAPRGSRVLRFSRARDTVAGVAAREPPAPGVDALANTLGDADSAEGRARAAEEALPVRDWDRYDLQDLLGAGGMGAVYRARDRRIDRQVAIKFIHAVNPQTT